MDDNEKRFQVWTTGSDLNNTENLMQNESTTKLIQTRKDPFGGREEVYRNFHFQLKIFCFQHSWVTTKHFSDFFNF